jgi:hypothetical protein
LFPSPLWGGIKGGGRSALAIGFIFNREDFPTPTLALPTRGREKQAFLPAIGIALQVSRRDQIRHALLQSPQIRVVNSGGFEGKHRLAQILRAAAPMTAGD